MNNCVLIGRLVKDPDLRTISNSDKSICSFTLAVNRPFKKDEADFFNIKVFGASAENCAKYLSKGSQVGLQGRIQNNNYTNKDGEKRYSTDIIADRVEFLSTKSKDSSPDLPKGFEVMPEDDDDDIPF